jgi:hypothetical protein
MAEALEYLRAGYSLYLPTQDLIELRQVLLNELSKRIDYEIDNILVLSTAHMTGTDNNLLDAGVTYDFPYYSLEYGWLILIPRNVDDLNRCLEDMRIGVSTGAGHFSFSDSFIEAMQLGFRLNCRYLRFDADGPIYEELPVNEW